MNWKTFDLKYDKHEQWAFEQMSYLLFCAEFNNRIGLFRYKNQAGIETEPIEKDGIFYGFQAKYYTTSIFENKCDIIDSIRKAKTKNSQLNIIYFYINQELSESTKIDTKKPQYQLEIEKEAEAIGVSIEWRVPSHFELQLSLPENKYIYDIFFNLEPNEYDLIDEVFKHNENILKAIQTEISFGDKRIKIDRNHIVDEILKYSQQKQNINKNRILLFPVKEAAAKRLFLKNFIIKILKIFLFVFLKRLNSTLTTLMIYFVLIIISLLSNLSMLIVMNLLKFS